MIKKLLEIDERLSDAIEHHVRATPILRSWAIFFREFTNIILIPYAFLVVLMHTRGFWGKLASLFLGMLLWIIVEFGIKKIFKRERPYKKDGEWGPHLPIEGYSFPSSHATLLGYLATFIFLKTKAIFLPSLLVFGAINRIFLNYHYISDVLVGLVLGFTAAIGLLGVIK